jgi:hypothetical protein
VAAYEPAAHDDPRAHSLAGQHADDVVDPGGDARQRSPITARLQSFSSATGARRLRTSAAPSLVPAGSAPL